MDSHVLVLLRICVILKNQAYHSFSVNTDEKLLTLKKHTTERYEKVLRIDVEA